jgi:hypothetical protein
MALAASSLEASLVSDASVPVGDAPPSSPADDASGVMIGGVAAPSAAPREAPPASLEGMLTAPSKVSGGKGCGFRLHAIIARIRARAPVDAQSQVDTRGAFMRFSTLKH